MRGGDGERAGGERKGCKERKSGGRGRSAVLPPALKRHPPSRRGDAASAAAGGAWKERGRSPAVSGAERDLGWREGEREGGAKRMENTRFFCNLTKGWGGVGLTLTGNGVMD